MASFFVRYTEKAPWRRSYECGGRDRSDAPINQGNLELREKARKGPPPEHGPADTLNWGFQPLEL